MEALSLILNDAKNNPVQILSSSIEKFEASIKTEQEEESHEAKNICTANFRTNVTLSGEYNAIDGCDNVSKCAIEAKESILKITSYVGEIDGIKNEISFRASSLRDKRTQRIDKKNELNSHREQFDEYKRKNDAHISNHNDARDALGNIKAVLIRSKTISASKKDKLAISREPIAAPIMRFLEKKTNDGSLRNSIVQEIVMLIDKLIASLKKASADQKEQFDLHVSLMEDTTSELREHIGDLSVDIENLEDVLDSSKSALNKVAGKLTKNTAFFKKKMEFCKRSFDIYVKACSDRSDELELIRQIKNIVQVHLSKDKLVKTNLRYKNEHNAQREELKKANMRLLHDQQRKHREELRKKNEQLLNQQQVKNDGKEAEELKKQIQRNAAIIQHRTALKSEDMNKSKNEQSIKDDTTRALKQVMVKTAKKDPVAP
eukprot:g6523.t1